ncbi:hypothetical protein GNI_131160 [Gregarina niphandrodes]|uniref:Uncharacterized protein n=1 Tax=Gregarina niphandrodes TaxID=110365 RepID=A0A023B1E5_GRENI|nr:hypothetical protein GNI_131160 [Gregarina niphandrodes]EZG47488.1 hypothetical protein GNI_131160 [Gregarina niphandrodes]|eukprot:XP_011132174.1 hypothetical protein GNI_131160 [Gregarina niphandrodes]
MPELRPNTWSAVQSFPAPDGSRTLRVAVDSSVMDALQSRELSGIRQSYVWTSLVGDSRRRLTTETEVQTGGLWVSLDQWFGRSPGLGCVEGESYRLPRMLIDHLRCGRVVSVQQTLTLDSQLASGVRNDVIVVMANGEKENLRQYLKRERASVEMCAPLSAEEANAFFSNQHLIGVRHSWSAAEQHTIEILHQGSQHWTRLDSVEVSVWNKIVKPHFRFTYSTQGKKDSVNSQSPWVE